MIKMILAIDDNNGMAKDGKMAWHNKEDFAMFKKLTIGDGKNIVMMGRKTYESLPFKPLNERVNIVMTSNPTEVNEVDNWNQVVEMSEMCNDLFIIGGASIYDQAISKGLPEVVYISRIPGDYNCDQFIDNVMDMIKLNYDQYENINFETFSLEVWNKK